MTSITFKDLYDQQIGQYIDLMHLIIERQFEDAKATWQKSICHALSSNAPLHRLTTRLNLTPFEQFAVMLTLAIELDEEVALGISKAQGQDGMVCPNMALALKLFEQVDDPINRIPILTSGNLHRLMQGCVCSLRSELHLRPAALSLLCGKLPELPGCSHRLYKNLPPLLAGEDIQQKLAACLRGASSATPAVVFLTGDDGSGKSFQLKKLSEQSNLPLLLIDAYELPKDADKLDDLADSLYLQLSIAPAIVCLRRYEDNSHQAHFVKSLMKSAPYFVISAKTDIELPGFDTDVYTLTLKTNPLTRTERRHIWEIMLEREGIAVSFNIQGICNQYKLTVGHIEQSTRALKRAHNNAMPVDEAAVREIIESASHQKLKGGLAKLIKPRFTWNDIILPDDTKDRLREICDRVGHEDRVLEEWGFAEKYPYGVGLSVLFYGAPGTGKTMAAHVIANELKTPLLYVDFSNMIDKYIGETEKHITLLFRQAKQMSAVLFFDEADALFAKRSEVSDATDRYANAQTACLLQCIEEYDGVVILATNLLTNFDAAFKRRIRYYMYFFMPDEALRMKIWESVFPKTAPLSKDVNFTELAKRELSAGSIKNIALTAAYLAAQDGEIAVRHLNRALHLELMKDGHLSSNTETFYG